MIIDYKKEKIYDIISKKPYGRALFVFDHGLGDLINFLPLFNEIKRLFPRCVFEIGTPISRNNSYLHPSIIPLGDNFRAIIPYCTHIFKIQYPEPTMEEKNSGIRKPYFCNTREMGIPNFIWKPYTFNWSINNNGSNKVGVHFTGSTNPKAKNIDFKIMESIWNEIEKCGYIPIETHMNCGNTLDKSYPSFINDTNSLRFNNLDLSILIDNIKECKFFFGIDSGPFYLACAILGTDRCIFLEKNMDLNWYFPYPMKCIDTKKYKKGDIKKVLQNLQH
jgi:ADP-heptose:LPS heptosyltransferase